MTVSPRTVCSLLLMLSALLCFYGVAQSGPASNPSSPTPRDSGETQSNHAAPPRSAGSAKAGQDTAPDAAFAATRNSLIFAFVLTVLICLVEIPAKSSMSPEACYANGSFPLYVALLAAGNCVAALFCSQLLKLSGQLVYFGAFLNGFFGVFAFQGIMSNTNITFLDKGVLTFDDWVSKARDYAVGAAIKKQARDDDEAKNNVAGELAAGDGGKLDAFIDTKLGKAVFEEIKAAAAAHGENAKLYKALAFTDKNFAAARAAAKALRNSKP